jgi:hypothetical protein
MPPHPLFAVAVVLVVPVSLCLSVPILKGPRGQGRGETGMAWTAGVGVVMMVSVFLFSPGRGRAMAWYG